MTDEIFFEGQRFISAGQAALLSSLTRDYVARLARDGKIIGRQVDRQWFVSQDSLRTFLVAQEFASNIRRNALIRERQKEYIKNVSPINSSTINPPTATTATQF